MVIINMHMLLALIEQFVLTLKMHTDMGDERGIRLRCICLGDAALRGSRMSARGRCGKGSESRIARSSLSNARSSVCATPRCLRINITIRQKKILPPFGKYWGIALLGPQVGAGSALGV